MEPETDSNNAEYFESYADLEVHKLMLSDTIRNEAYRAAICDNSELFKDKVVLDVGTGTGFLAVLCARAGASKVYAVEASDMGELATITVHENEVADRVQVIIKKIEEVDLPEKVDIIVSEWMGFYLLHESMLDSVVYARDKFLKPNGVMYPYKCILYTAPSYSPELFKFWEDISGVKMSTIGSLYRTKYTGKPEIMDVHATDILSKPIKVIQFNTKDIKLEDLQNITQNFAIKAIKCGIINGISLWFDVHFVTSKENSDVVLSTAPVTSPSTSTHWKQTVIVLGIEKQVEQDEAISYSLNISRNKINARFYDIQLSIEDEGKQEEEIREGKKEEFYKHHQSDEDFDEYNSGDDD